VSFAPSVFFLSSGVLRLARTPVIITQLLVDLELGWERALFALLLVLFFLGSRH